MGLKRNVIMGTGYDQYFLNGYYLINVCVQYNRTVFLFLQITAITIQRPFYSKQTAREMITDMCARCLFLVQKSVFNRREKNNKKKKQRTWIRT